MKLRRRLGGAATALVCLLTLAPASAQVVEADLEVVGHLPLAGIGPFGDVAAVGTTVVVASEACPRPAVTVVDAKDPGKPRVVATIALPAGATAADLDAAEVGTDAFTGDLVAIALAPSPCAGVPGAAGGALYYDLTNPAAPRLLSTVTGSPGLVSLAQRAGGRAVAVRLDGPDAVAVDDLADPSRARTLAGWPLPSAASPPGCAGAGRAVSVQLHDDGQGLLVVVSDGRIFDLELTGEGTISGEGTPSHPGGRNTYGAVLPIGRRTLAVVSEEPGDEPCPGPPGLRVLELNRGNAPLEVEPVRFTTPVRPGRLAASGELAYVAWHGDGLRIVDLGQVRARAVAQFIPESADVVGVALLPEHVVVTDRASGLYVLRRPDEGGAEPSFWSQLVGVIPYILGAVLMAAFFVVPRLVMGRASVGSEVPGPLPSGVRRRRA